MSLDSVGNDKIDPELKDFIVGEQVKSQIRAQIRRLNNMCFERCFEKPTGKLESKQENCVHNCIGRFLDTNGFIAQRFSKRSNPNAGLE
jgi:import inner membrane translocase subunit TIM8